MLFIFKINIRVFKTNNFFLSFRLRVTDKRVLVGTRNVNVEIQHDFRLIFIRSIPVN